MNNNKTEPCQENPKRNSPISRNWKHFSQAEWQKLKPTRTQVNVHAVCKISLHNSLCNRIMVLVELESGFEQGAIVSDVPVSSSIHSRPPSDQNAITSAPAIVMASATVSATTTRNSESPPTKKQVCDPSATRKFCLFIIEFEKYTY